MVHLLGHHHRGRPVEPCGGGIATPVADGTTAGEGRAPGEKPTRVYACCFFVE